MNDSDVTICAFSIPSMIGELLPSTFTLYYGTGTSLPAQSTVLRVIRRTGLE
jgi:hypothetical protein